MSEILSDNEILSRLVNIIVEALRIDPDTVSLKSNLLTDFDAESIDLVDIRFRIEETFGFKMDQEEFARGLADGSSAAAVEHMSVERIVGYVKKRLAEQSAP